MSEETIIMKGALEDHRGRILYPDTESDQVIRANGQSVEEALVALLANFANYLPLVGGTVNGNVTTKGGKYSANTWGHFSAGTDGTVMLAENAYIHPTNNTYCFANTHATLGARGIILRNGFAGVWYFDTGNISTTAGAVFAPTFISITDKTTKTFHGDLDSITENGITDGVAMINGTENSWYYIQHIGHSLDGNANATQIAYSFFSNDVLRRRKTAGVWSAWEPFLTQSNTPTQHYSTVAPTASDGKDGDVWDVYV